LFLGFNVSDLEAHDLIASPVLIVLKAANECKDKTAAISQL
jgi:endonuclease V-like protein UPF0215 family